LEFVGFKTRQLKRYPPVDIKNEKFSRNTFYIQMSDGEKLAAYKYEPNTVNSTGITIIILHGFTDTALNPMDVEIASRLVSLGHLVISYDIRKHGNSTTMKYAHYEPDYFPRAMLDDSKEVLNYIKKLPEVNPKKLAIIGFSYGGIIALSGMVDDPDIGVICAGCAVYDYKTLWDYHSENSSWLVRFLLKKVFFHKQNYKDFYDILDSVSPKTFARRLYESDDIILQNLRKKEIYLLHCKDDPLVIYSINFIKNKEDFKVPDENTLIFEDGGHDFSGHEEEVMNFLKKCISTNF
jgi:pimeloyl-ACP methyl ester carboxylesterase